MGDALIYLLPYLFSVELPKGKWYNLIISTDNKLCGDTNNSADWRTFSIQLPPGSYILLFLSSQVTEEQAEMVVNVFNNPFSGNHGKFYDYSQKERTYTVADKFVKTALESFHSLLKSKGLDTDKNYAIVKQVKT